MQTIDVIQGSREWAAARAQHFTASEAPAMMGASKYQTRTDLLAQKHSGIVPEVDAAKQALFDKGHAAESAYRPIAEAEIGQDLYPVTGTLVVEGLALLASFDGLTVDDRIGFEHKLYRGALAEELDLYGEPGPEYFWQLEHQLLVSGAERIMFVTSDGTDTHARWVWYESKPERRAALIAGWKQFREDLSTFVPTSPAAVEKLIAEPVEALPAPVVQVTGQLSLQDNFKVFEERLRHFLAEKLIREPKTDQDFADLDLQIRAMKNGREALKSAKAGMLAQVQPVDQAAKTADMLDTLLQKACAASEALLKSEKERRKGEIVATGITGLKAHVEALDARLGGKYMPAVPCDFGAAVHGLKSLKSMEDKVSAALANAKIAASTIADRIDANLKTLAAVAPEHAALFPDKAAIVQKAPDDLQALVRARVAEHDAAVKRRAEEAAEKAREEIRRQEQEKAQREAAARAAAEAAEREARERQERAAREADARAAAAAAQPPAAPPAPVAAPPAPAVVPLRRPAEPVAAPMTPPSLTVGAISKRLGFVVSGDFLTTTLNCKPATLVRGNGLWHERDLGLILAALIRHLESIQAQQAA